MSGGDSALYVYAFTRRGEPLQVHAPAVEGDGEVRTLPLGEIDAVVSPVSRKTFEGPEAEARLEDLDWMTERALRHEAVVEEVMHGRPVLPLTFGVVFSRERTLREAVEPHRGEIARFLEFIADKEEWAVKVYADLRVLRARVEGSEDFRSLLGRLPDAPGARYFHEKRLEREVERLAARKRAELVEGIRKTLEPMALAKKHLRLLSREMTGRPDEMVLNLALLLAGEQVERFHERVEETREAHRAWGLRIEATGPWPPYNFGPDLGVQS